MTLLGRFQALGSHKLAASATAFGVIALAATLTATPASAGVIETGVLADVSTTLCLDSNSAGVVYTDNFNYCNGSNNYQIWRHWDNGSLGSGLQDVATGLCLDSNYAGNVYTDSCNANNSYQEWTPGGEGPGTTWQDVQTGKCLNSNNGGNVYTTACNWNDYYQNWLW